MWRRTFSSLGCFHKPWLAAVPRRLRAAPVHCPTLQVAGPAAEPSAGPCLPRGCPRACGDPARSWAATGALGILPGLPGGLHRLREQPKAVGSAVPAWASQNIRLEVLLCSC